jgi:hypothetical protein
MIDEKNTRVLSLIYTTTMTINYLLGHKSPTWSIYIKNPVFT